MLAVNDTNNVKTIGAANQAMCSFSAPGVKKTTRDHYCITFYHIKFTSEGPEFRAIK